MKKHQHFKKYKKFKVVNLTQKKKQGVKIWSIEDSQAKKRVSGNPILKAIYLSACLHTVSIFGRYNISHL